jgi:hydrogenase maturation protein HypF
VALSGGVFQNRLLLRLTSTGLIEKGFKVFAHHLVPCNDGGISLGQAVIANFSKE